MDKLRNQKEYEGNPVGLSQEVAEEVAQHLDRHLASFITIYHQYHKHHWMVEGPQFRDLHLFFEDNYNQIHEGYDAIAERLTVMGVAPTCHPANVAKLAYIEHEEEGGIPNPGEPGARYGSGGKRSLLSCESLSNEWLN